MEKDVTIKIGIIRGAGTGNRLANIFKKFLKAMISQDNEKRKRNGDEPILFDFIEDMQGGKPYIYDSHKSLTNLAEGDQQRFKTYSEQDAERLSKTLAKWYGKGIRTVFQTALNAESLYLFRQKTNSVKEIFFVTPTDRRLLIIRDQAEGFYANTNYFYDDEHQEIHFSGKLSKSHQQEIARYALLRGEKLFGNNFDKWALYKHHLFGSWISEWLHEIDSSFLVKQPDTGFTDLASFIKSAYNSKTRLQQSANNGMVIRFSKPNLMILCANEVGDLIFEIILSAANIGHKNELYTRNILLASPYQGNMTLYQTIHGSADDKANGKKDAFRLKPFATLRIAADIAENIFEIPNSRNKMEEAIVFSKMKSCETTKDILSCVKQKMQISFPRIVR